ncbi:MAG: large subunit ribosomal protein [Thermotogaceae bacterium]|jgi:large subunit ribosomal protein L25|nr:large subunit ribosomal protein [Thermotogaceae bacterium]
MRKFAMEVQARDRVKTSGSRKVRGDGFIPVVAYGPDFETRTFEVDFAAFDSVIHKISNTTPVTLQIKNEEGNVEEILTYLKMVQRHKVNDRPIHIDFYVPSAGHVMNIEVPIHFINEPIGIEHGGVLEHHYDAIPIEALPENIPESIEIDIADLDVGEFIQMKDVSMGEGVKSHIDGEEYIVSVLEPRVIPVEEEEETEELEEESMEPEVIGEETEEETKE